MKGLINLIFTPYGDSIRFKWHKSNIRLKALDELITASSDKLRIAKIYVHTSKENQKVIGLLLSKMEQLESKVKEKERLLKLLEEIFLFFSESVDRKKK